jgi:hypothetical protein
MLLAVCLLALGASVLLDQSGALDNLPITANVVAAAVSIPVVLLLTVGIVERRARRQAERDKVRHLYFLWRALQIRIDGYRRAMLRTFLGHESVEDGRLNAERYGQLLDLLEAIRSGRSDARVLRPPIGDCAELSVRAASITAALRSFIDLVAERELDPRDTYALIPRVERIETMTRASDLIWTRAATTSEGQLEMTAWEATTTMAYASNVLAVMAECDSRTQDLAVVGAYEAGYDFMRDDPLAHGEWQRLMPEMLAATKIDAERNARARDSAQPSTV